MKDLFKWENNKKNKNLIQKNIMLKYKNHITKLLEINFQKNGKKNFFFLDKIKANEWL